MEVTSQAYKTDRVYGVHFNNGMFLNISKDHISDAEHPNFEDYLNCKLKLLYNCDNLIINADTDEFKVIINAFNIIQYLKKLLTKKYICNIIYIIINLFI